MGHASYGILGDGSDGYLGSGCHLIPELNIFHLAVIQLQLMLEDAGYVAEDLDLCKDLYRNSRFDYRRSRFCQHRQEHRMAEFADWGGRIRYRR